MIITSSAQGIDYNELATLKELARLGAMETATDVTTGELADRLDISPQTISRRLHNLEEMKMITRTTRPDGQSVFVENEGVEALELEYQEYQDLFADRSALSLSGTVADGVGEGQHFVSLSGYHEQFVERLGYEPYPGTFNVHLTADSARKRTRLDRIDGIEIEGWEEDDRSYGGATAYPVRVETPTGERYERCHLLVPDRTHHGADELEVLAPDKLREALSVTEGEEVTVDVLR